ncbi:hypothetical protein E2C01_058776 [Portunus trituberculatus]|uniref:Uncharacterized protein n=1 Tax=Portunus trituberculatus TaxID=210409 RepID=A0A5B7H6E4_PORTR|nr:hypothetical protein [Portunus trituberculatus]
MTGKLAAQQKKLLRGWRRSPEAGAISFFRAALMGQVAAGSSPLGPATRALHATRSLLNEGKRKKISKKLILCGGSYFYLNLLCHLEELIVG